MYIALDIFLIRTVFFYCAIIPFKKFIKNISHSLPGSILRLLVSGITEQSPAERVSQLLILPLWNKISSN